MQIESSPTALVVTARPLLRWLLGSLFIGAASVCALGFHYSLGLDPGAIGFVLVLMMPGALIGGAPSVKTRFDATRGQIVQTRRFLLFARTRTYPLIAMREIRLTSFRYRYENGYRIALGWRRGEIPLSSGYDDREEKALAVAKRLETFLNARGGKPIVLSPVTPGPSPYSFGLILVLAFGILTLLPILSGVSDDWQRRHFEEVLRQERQDALERAQRLEEKRRLKAEAQDATLGTGQAGSAGNR